MATTDTGTTTAAAGAQFASVSSGGSKQASAAGQIYSTTAGKATTLMTPLGVTGGSLPHNNMMPYLTLNFCIALQGIFPARSGFTQPTPIPTKVRKTRVRAKTRKGA